MYSYTIASSMNAQAFDNVCSLLESKIEDIKKEILLEDVDGTQIQIYFVKGKRIKVFNDPEVDAVYIDAELCLEKIINQL